MNDDRRLIEDYLPIEAISAEASLEKRTPNRKGHMDKRAVVAQDHGKSNSEGAGSGHKANDSRNQWTPE